MEDSEELHWIGARQGVLYSGCRTISFHKAVGIDASAELEFLHSTCIFDIKEDTERNIWIATNYEGIQSTNLRDKTQAATP